MYFKDKTSLCVIHSSYLTIWSHTVGSREELSKADTIGEYSVTLVCALLPWHACACISVTAYSLNETLQRSVSPPQKMVVTYTSQFISKLQANITRDRVAQESAHVVVFICLKLQQNSPKCVIIFINLFLNSFSTISMLLC